MSVWDENGLRGTYSHYERGKIRQLCSKIPPERRKAFLEEIQAKIVLKGLSTNDDILKLVRKKLERKE